MPVAPFNGKQLSAIASLITTAAARRIGLCLPLHAGSIKQPPILDYLRALKRYLKGRKAILLWDRLPAHRGTRAPRYLDRQTSWLTTE